MSVRDANFKSGHSWVLNLKSSFLLRFQPPRFHSYVQLLKKKGKLFCKFILDQPDAITTLTQILKFLAKSLWRLGRFAGKTARRPIADDETLCGFQPYFLM